VKDDIGWKMGRGNKIMFWKDYWEGGRSLRDAYPWLYANSMQKVLRIKDVEQWTGKGWEWKLRWRRDWFEWERPSVEVFL